MCYILARMSDFFSAESLGAPLSREESARYEWQMWVSGVGESGQKKIKSASVLVSRCGGVGGLVACELAAAGVGCLILAHGGMIKESDLNRQILMTHDWVGRPRVESAKRRILELNPCVSVEAIPENISPENAASLVSLADVVVDCAPLFSERFAMNDAAVRHSKPMVECAMFDTDIHLTTFLPGQTPCLRCIYPEEPVEWKRQFPVFGATAGALGCLAAMEVIKILTGIGEPLANQMLVGDLRSMSFKKMRLRRNPSCPVCCERLKLEG